MSRRWTDDVRRRVIDSVRIVCGRVYVTVRCPSVCPSVCPFVCHSYWPLQQRGRVCAGDIDRLLHVGRPPATALSSKREEQCHVYSRRGRLDTDLYSTVWSFVAAKHAFVGSDERHERRGRPVRRWIHDQSFTAISRQRVWHRQCRLAGSRVQLLQHRQVCATRTFNTIWFYWHYNVKESRHTVWKSSRLVTSPAFA